MHFRPLKRTSQALSREECLQILAASESGVLALAGDGGWPYAVPGNYVLSPDGERLWIHGAPCGHKYESILKDGRVSLCVVSQGKVIPEIYATSFKSVILFGQGRALTQWPDRRAAIEAFCDRHAPGRRPEREAEIERFQHVGVIEVKILHMTGKESLNLAQARAAAPQADA